MLYSILVFLKTAAQHYGLYGLLMTSAIGSTIFVPFSVEAALAMLIPAGINPVLLILVATAGSLIGSGLNYVIGFFSFGWFKKRFIRNEKQHEEIKKLDKFVHVSGWKFETYCISVRIFHDKFVHVCGWKVLFIALLLPISLPVDPLTILAGAGKMEVRIFLLVVFFGKLIKYSMVVVLLMFFRYELIKYDLLGFLGI